MNATVILLALLGIAIVIFFIYQSTQNGLGQLNKLYERANAEYLQGNFTDAIKILNIAIEKYPHYQYYGLRGSCYYHLKQYDLALSEYNRSIEVEPNYEKNSMAYEFRDKSKKQLNNLTPNTIVDNQKEKKNFYKIEDLSYLKFTIENDGAKKFIDSIGDLADLFWHVWKDTDPMDEKGKIELQMYFIAFALYQLKDDPKLYKSVTDRAAISLTEPYLNAFDPIELQLFKVTVKDPWDTIIEKIKIYEQEIENMSKEKFYVSKFIFASFFMYSLMPTKMYLKELENLTSDNVTRFCLASLALATVEIKRFCSPPVNK
jgi:tetratricopeptide (TPR) repeat protein